jgi:hypothetical protein
MRKIIYVFGAAFALATALFWGTMLTSPPTSEAALSSPGPEPSCVEAGRDVGVWVESEAYRRSWVRAEGYDNFNLLLAWAREAQRQCASGSNERAVENFRAIEGMIATIEEHRRPLEED